MIWWSAHDSLPGYGPNKTKAKELVDQSNYNGETLELLGGGEFNSIPTPKLIAQVIQQSANDIGVDIDINIVSPALEDKRSKNGDYHLKFKGLGTASAAGNVLLTAIWHPAGVVGEDWYQQALREQGIYEEMLPVLNKGLNSRGEEKKAAFRKVQHILVEKEALIIPLFYKELVYGKYNDIGEFTTPPLSEFARWEKLQHYK